MIVSLLSAATCMLLAGAVYHREYVVYRSILQSHKLMFVEYYASNKPEQCDHLSLHAPNVFMSPLAASMNVRQKPAPGSKTEVDNSSSFWASMFFLNEGEYSSSVVRENVVSSCHHYYTINNSTAYDNPSFVDVLTLIAIKSTANINTILFNVVSPFIDVVVIPLLDAIDYVNVFKTFLVCMLTTKVSHIMENIRRLYIAVYGKIRRYRRERINCENGEVERVRI